VHGNDLAYFSLLGVLVCKTKCMI